MGSDMQAEPMYILNQNGASKLHLILRIHKLICDLLVKWYFLCIIIVTDANPAQRKFVERKNFGSKAHRQIWNKCGTFTDFLTSAKTRFRIPKPETVRNNVRTPWEQRTGRPAKLVFSPKNWKKKKRDPLNHRQETLTFIPELQCLPEFFYPAFMYSLLSARHISTIIFVSRSHIIILPSEWNLYSERLYRVYRSNGTVDRSRSSKLKHDRSLLHLHLSFHLWELMICLCDSCGRKTREV